MHYRYYEASIKNRIKLSKPPRARDKTRLPRVSALRGLPPLLCQFPSNKRPFNPEVVVLSLDATRNNTRRILLLSKHNRFLEVVRIEWNNIFRIKCPFYTIVEREKPSLLLEEFIADENFNFRAKRFSKITISAPRAGFLPCLHNRSVFEEAAMFLGIFRFLPKRVPLTFPEACGNKS